MARTYLQLCNDLAREAGASGAAQSISSTAGQTGEAARIVNWVKQAHTEIQNKHTVWRWMRSRFTVNTTASDGIYEPTDCTDSRLSAAISRFGRWLIWDDSGRPNVKIYLTSGGVAGERWMAPVPWDYFVAVYRFGPQNDGPPVHVAVDPQNNLVLGPSPDAIYTVSGEYGMAAFEFSSDSDTPEFPARFHDLVWKKALEYYGRYHAAPEVLSRGETEGGKMMRALEADQLPEIRLGEPLA